jgi:hypothetical protein
VTDAASILPCPKGCAIWLGLSRRVLLAMQEITVVGRLSTLTRRRERLDAALPNWFGASAIG